MHGPRLTSFAVALVAALSGRALAQPADDLPTIRLTESTKDLLRLGVPNATGDGASEATEVARRDFQVMGFFKVLDPASFPPALQQEGLEFSSALWTQVGAQGVVKMELKRGGPGVVLEGRLYQTARGDAATLARAYQGADVRQVVHAFVNDVIGEFTGSKGPFGSRIVFAQPKGREIMSVGADGSQPHVLTNMNSENMLPAIAPDGSLVAFTSFLRGGPDLYVVSTSGGRAKRISQRPGMNTGAAWMPDRSILVTLSHEGSPDIYRIAASDGKILKRITTEASIDSSASPSPDGSQIAFVSNRQGTPQIFIASAGGGGGATRVTFQGRYNQTPRWNPRPDKPLIAFTGRDERGVFDIFMVDLKTKKIDRLTQNQGSNYDPAWSPDGRLLAYGSSRGGLYVVNVDTRQETQIWKGAPRSPSWGPVPGQKR